MKVFDVVSILFVQGCLHRLQVLWGVQKAF
jgi:hypothetical protein